MSSRAARRPFALMDRDGTLIVDKHYLNDPGGIELVPGAIEGLKMLTAAGVGLILVTNQSGIARGLLSEATLQRIHERLREMLLEAGISLDAIYYCPHGPDARCRCRKPAPGMVLDAMADFRITAADCVLIGDQDADMQAARSGGIRGIRIRHAGAAHPLQTRPLQTGEVADFMAACVEALRYFGLRGDA